MAHLIFFVAGDMFFTKQCLKLDAKNVPGPSSVVDCLLLIQGYWWKYVVNCLGSLSQPRNCVCRLTDHTQHNLNK